MARNSHTANGMATSIPAMPLGRNGPPPSGSSTAVPSLPTPMLSAQREKSTSPEKIALVQNTVSTASARMVTSTDTLNDNSTPIRLSPTNSTYMPIHHSGCTDSGVSKMPPRYDPMKYTITAGVSTYSMFSARPVTKPPQGPIALRANEYAPPVCGNAGDISARQKHRHTYISPITMAAKNRPPKPPAAGRSSTPRSVPR